MTDGPECCGCNYGERPCNCDCHLGDDTSVTDSISADIARPMTVAEAAKRILDAMGGTDADELAAVMKAADAMALDMRKGLGPIPMLGSGLRTLSHEGGE